MDVKRWFNGKFMVGTCWLNGFSDEKEQRPDYSLQFTGKAPCVEATNLRRIKIWSTVVEWDKDIHSDLIKANPLLVNQNNKTSNPKNNW